MAWQVKIAVYTVSVFVFAQEGDCPSCSFRFEYERGGYFLIQAPDWSMTYWPEGV